MRVINTDLKGCFILQPKVFEDNRGYFMQSYNNKGFNEILGQDINFIQDNESFSVKGTLRGLHYQKNEYAQAKLVRVIEGKVLDVAVDIRKKSSTFGQHISLILSKENKKQLFIPRGFAHGFVVLSKTALFSYKCDNYYNKESEGGILFNDSELNINWRIPEHELVISDKDKILPTIENARL